MATAARTETEDDGKESSTTTATSSKQPQQQQQPKEPKPFSSIPGPWPPIPFFGTTWQNLLGSIVGRFDMHKLHDIYHEKYLKYGPIYREYLNWSTPIVHIFDPEDMKTMFQSQGRCPNRPPNEFEVIYRQSLPERYPNVGLPHLNGELWLKHRKLIAPSIATTTLLTDNLKSQNLISKDFIDFLWHLRDPETNIVQDVQEATYRLSLEAVCNLCLNTRFGALNIYHDYDDDPGEQNCSTKTECEIMIEATKTMFESFNILYHGFPWWKLFKTASYEEMERSEEAMYVIAAKYVESVMEKLSKEPGEKFTVLGNLLANDDLTEDDVKMAIIDFIIGGISTVSVTFAFLFHQLAANPDVQQKLYEEIQSVLHNKDDGSDSDSSITYNDLAQMPYLKACVLENFRINCVVPGNVRITDREVVMSDYRIPANTLIYAHINTTGRLEKYFKHAHQFRPERWIHPEEKNTIHPFAVTTFGYGKRMCPGKRFAESVLHVSLAYLVRNFRLELVNKDDHVEMKHVFMVIPANPVSVRLVRR